MIIKRDMVVVLGAGYVARFMLSLTSFYGNVQYTSRDPDTHLTWVPRNQRLRFDLSKPDTWNIPPCIDLLWCFPAVPFDSVRQFAARIKGSFERLVVLGSTSAYMMCEPHDYPPQWIDESAPIDLSQPRVQGEEFLRKECGATVLRAAGIYGPNRNPIDWIRTGRVRPSQKYVNLIHVEDLAAICLWALARGNPGEIYNVSDGVPRRWDEIYNIARNRWHVPVMPEQSIQEAGKRIRAHKLQERFGESLRHPDLFASLEELERSCATNAKAP